MYDELERARRFLDTSAPITYDAHSVEGIVRDCLSALERRRIDDDDWDMELAGLREERDALDDVVSDYRDAFKTLAKILFGIESYEFDPTRRVQVDELMHRADALVQAKDKPNA